MKGINDVWDNDEMRVGKDWFSDFLKRNGDIALKKPERLSRARARGLNNTEVDDILICTEICVRNSMSVTNHISFSVWMRPGFLVIMFLRKLPTYKELENLTVIAYCGVCDEFIPTFTIFEGGSLQRNIQAGFTAGSAFAMTDSDFINNGVFSPTTSTFSEEILSRKMCADLGWAFFLFLLYVQKE
jgi:hypothetical protein